MKKYFKRLIGVALAITLMTGLGIVPGQVKAAENDKAVSVDVSSKNVKLYVGMQYAIPVRWGYGEDSNRTDQTTLSQLTNATFSSDNTKVAEIDEKGIVTAKKAGTAKIDVASDEVNCTVNIKVLKVKKVNKKKLTKEIPLQKDAYRWPLSSTPDKNDKLVKQGILKAGKSYDMFLCSLREYKQPDKSKRYVFVYEMVDKKGKAIKNVPKQEICAEDFLTYHHLCDGIDWNMKFIKTYLAKQKEIVISWETSGYQDQSKMSKKQKQKYYQMLFEYGWKDFCA